MPEPAAAIEIRNLRFQYPDGLTALEDVTFSTSPGEKVGLVGPSGAGKSTLLTHLNGLLPQTLPEQNGAIPTITICGLPMCRSNASEIRRLVGLLFQDPDDQLFCPTVAEDVAFGPLNLGLNREDIANRVRESLSAVGLDGFGPRSTMRLSVGERKRVCLAGLLACDPKILALDEPTSNLDPRARRQLLGYLGQFEGSQLIATHDLDFVVEHCDRVLILDRGKIHADGDPRVVLSKPNLMEQHGLEVPLSLLHRHGTREV